jgi:hypothetical protein
MARRQRETAMTTEEDPAIEPAENIEADMDPEDTLVFLFMCCHPALSTSSAIALTLTLRAVGGLTTAEIANAFMVPKATMAQRISRTKQSIKASSAGTRQRRTNGWALPAGCSARAFVREALRFREGRTSLSNGRGRNHQHSGTELSDDPGGPARRASQTTEEKLSWPGIAALNRFNFENH